MMESSLLITEKEGAATFLVRVIPRAKRSEVVGALQGALKVRLAAPPVEGAANDALVRFLAKRLSVRANQVEILSGHTGRMKTIRVGGLSAAEIHRRLQGQSHREPLT